MTPPIRAVNPRYHRHFGLRSERDYRFFENHVSLPLWSAEATYACRSLPIGFIQEAGAWHVVAITGLRPEENLLIDRAGQWLGRYLPAQLRGHPFRHARRQGARARSILALVEDDHVLTHVRGITGGPWESLFNDGDEPGPPIQRARHFYKQLLRAEQGRGILEQCEQSGLLVPWEIAFDDPETGHRRQVEGVYRIDEERLTRLGDAAFIHLRAGGGLLLLHSHLISLPVIEELKERLGDRSRQGPAGIVADLDQGAIGGDERLFEFKDSGL